MDETIRALLFALADRVYSWSLDQQQEEDWRVLTMARLVGWVPWHEREPGKTQYEESLRRRAERQAGESPR